MRRVALIPLLLVALIVGAAYALPAKPQTVIVGTVTLLHQDDLDHGTAKMKTGVVVNGILVRVKGLRDDDLGRLVSLTGKYHGKTFVATEVQILEQPRLSAVNRTRIAVIPINFTDDRSEPATVAQLTALYFGPRPSVRDWYETISYGTQQYTGTVFPWVHISKAKGSGCDNGWSAEANTLVDRTGYDTTVYMWPSAPGCPFTGSAGLGSAVINGVPGSLSPIIHELGHTNGLEHSQNWTCTDGAGVTVALSATDNCTHFEYGDVFDNMGSGGLRGFNEWQRAQLGWLTPVTITQSGTYTLAPIDNTTGQRFLRVARGNGDYLNIEYRTNDGTGVYDTFQPDWPVVLGVSIRVAPDPRPLQDWVFFPKLVDATPDTPTSWDASLTVGKSLTDPKTGVKITTLAVSPAGATVQIDFAGPPPTTTSTTSTTTTTTAAPPTTTTTTLPGGGAESYTAGDDSNGDGAWASFKLAQTFTAATSRSVSLFQAMVFVKGTGKPTCEAWETAGGRPSKRLALGAMTATGTASWATCTLNTAVLLTQGRQYALVLGSTGGNGSNALFWRVDTTSPGYAGGALVRSASSGAWNTGPNLGRDQLFRVP